MALFKELACRSTKAVGDEAEAKALAWLVQRGLVLVQRNYRVAAGPHARGGEIDLIMRERGADGINTLVFIEVRARASARQGGALASVTATKRARIIRTAQHFLLRWPQLPPCRFDVVTLQGGQVEWLRGAFDAS